MAREATDAVGDAVVDTAGDAAGGEACVSPGAVAHPSVDPASHLGPAQRPPEPLAQPLSQQFAQRLARRLARRGLGTTAPNPSLGAVILRQTDGAILGAGVTQPGGRPHAEVVAINAAVRAGHALPLSGATMVVTLEPCCHWGRSGPCTEAIVAAGLDRVVIGAVDPNPQVAGQGIAGLRAAGVAVEVCDDPDSRWLSAGHALRMLEQRPFIQAKMALSADGLIARGAAGRPVWVTGPQARAHGHLMRARADAIMVGRGTFEADAPALTVRLPGLAHRSPQPVLAQGRSEGRSEGRSQGRSPLPTSKPVPAHWISLPAAKGQPDIGEAIAELLRQRPDMTRLLIEGGPTLVGQALEAGIVDELLLYVADGGLDRAVASDAIVAPVTPDGLKGDPQWIAMGVRRLGPDRLFTFANAATHHRLSQG